jgi:Ribbon-helix-helix protein, copG family
MMFTYYHHDVRTTLTLEEDVKAKLDQEIRKTGKSFKAAVNDYLRLGLAVEARMKPVKPFVVHARPLGLPSGLSYDHVEELIEQLEGPLHK